MWCVVESFDEWWDDGVKAVYGPFGSEEEAESFCEGIEWGEVHEMKKEPKPE